MYIDSATAIITAVTSAIAAVAGILTLYLTMKKDKPHFDLTAIYTGHAPDRKPRGIHIQNPTKPIDHCQVFCNGVPLDTLFGVYLQKWTYIHVGGSADFFLPDNIADIDNATITVKDGRWKTLQKAKLKDIPHPL